MARLRGLLIVRPDAAALATSAAEEFTRAAEKSAGPFRVALSGGGTPRLLYGLLARPPYLERIPWDRVHAFWGDERCVPPDHADSNYRMAREAFLSRVPLPPANIHRIVGEMADANAAAGTYEELLRRELGPRPRFDWVFLGLGADGHTASLFPGTAVVEERVKLVAAVWVEAKKTYRVTLTLPVLNAAANVAFLVTGAGKTEIARAVIEGAASPQRPASLVAPDDGRLLWFLDREAAKGLKSAHAV